MEWVLALKFFGGFSGLVIGAGLLVQLGRMMQRIDRHLADEEKHWMWSRGRDMRNDIHHAFLFDALGIDRMMVKKAEASAGLDPPTNGKK